MEFNTLLPFNDLTEIEIIFEFSAGMLPFSANSNMYFNPRISLINEMS